MTFREIIAIAALTFVQCAPPDGAPAKTGAPSDNSVWAVDPKEPGPNEPPVGHSVFDELVSTVVNGERVYDVPFPFQVLTARIANHVNSERDIHLQQVLIPIGRSLQRTNNRPNYFGSPRIVVAVDGDAPVSAESNLFLKDRLFLGYQAKAGIIEVISYNEQAGRFEFQIVSDYEEGSEPSVTPADRATCIGCHHGLTPIFPRALWSETNANEDVRELLAQHATEFFGIPVRQGVDVPQLIDQAIDRSALFAAHQLVWSKGCEDSTCRADALFAMLTYRLRGYRHGAGAEQARFVAALRSAWPRRWPGGLKIPSPDIPDRDIIGNLKRASARAGQPDLINKAGSPEFASFLDGTFTEAGFSPTTPRDPLDVWQVDDVNIEFAQQVTAGLAGFFSQQDIRRIRESLPEPEGRGSTVDDFPRLRAAIDKMVRSGSDGLSDKPLRPGIVIPELIGRLADRAGD